MPPPPTPALRRAAFATFKVSPSRRRHHTVPPLARQRAASATEVKRRRARHAVCRWRFRLRRAKERAALYTRAERRRCRCAQSAICLRGGYFRRPVSLRHGSRRYLRYIQTGIDFIRDSAHPASARTQNCRSKCQSSAACRLRWWWRHTPCTA
jgi:hypothetical protein